MSAPSSSRPVQADDRVNDVLARDEALVEVFIRHSEHFAKLRNRTMRKVMGRLVTVDDAARIADVPVEALVRDLNSALGIEGPVAAGPRANAPGSPAAGAPSVRPADAPVVEVDVREDLRAGREPLARIMGAVGSLQDGEVLLVRATFQPVPLLTVLGKRGFVNESVEHGPDDWSVWFWRDATPSKGESPSAPVSSAMPAAFAGATIDDDKTVWLDVRGLQPPEPLMRTMTALETLPEGHQLIQLNSRVPQLLLPMLAERGFACELDESHADRVLLRIWRPA